MPERTLASPEFLFDHAREYQNRLTELQEEINIAIQGAQTVVSSILRTSTAETLRQYEVHIEQIENEYTPHLEIFNELTAGSCKNSAETILNSVITFTGFEASNCAKSYDERVTEIVATANGALVDFDEVYSELQSSVVKAFVGRNVFISPEEIEGRIADIFEIVEERWEESKPEFEAVRRSVAIGIGEQNIQLGQCHDLILQVAASQFSWFRSIANTCNEFDNQKASDKIGKFTEPWVKLSKEFYEQFEKLESFKWKN